MALELANFGDVTLDERYVEHLLDQVAPDTACTYGRLAHNFAYLAGNMDNFALWTALKAICRKNDISTAQAMRRFYRNSGIQVDTDCRLEQFRNFSMKRDYRRPEPYSPGQNNQESDDEMEATFTQHNERGRLGSMDLRYRILQRDSYRCRRCGKSVTVQDAAIDHRVPVNRFASFAQANTEDNLQTLCLDCHKEKHNAK